MKPRFPFTMMPTILPNSRAIIDALRTYFLEHNVECFEINTASEFSFRTTHENTGLVVYAATELPVPRLRMLTSLLCDTVNSREVCEMLANHLNTQNRFITVVLPQETKRYAIESSLVLGDGMCLQSQLTTFADAHMAGVALLAPLLGRFSRGEIDAEELGEQLSVLAALNRSTSDDGRSGNVEGPEFELPGRN